VHSDPELVPEAIRRVIPADVIATAERSIRGLADWSAGLPSTSVFYMDVRPHLPKRDSLPAGVKRSDVMLADIFFDVHSIFAAQCLVRGWRAAQLSEGLQQALCRWNITAAAVMTRALVETAAAWAIESEAIAAAWTKAKTLAPRNVDDALAIRKVLYDAVLQAGFGTRIEAISKRHPRIQRTNILTFVQKAAKRFGYPRLPEQYEILCDAVHPSWGSTECFWQEAGVADEIKQFRVLLNREAVGWLDTRDQREIRTGSRLSSVVFECIVWSTDRLHADLRRFETLCRDMSLTFRIHHLANMDYWGVPRPSDSYDSCACGSGNKSKFCRHQFGVR